jgi:hypothetical protein
MSDDPAETLAMFRETVMDALSKLDRDDWPKRFARGRVLALR